MLRVIAEQLKDVVEVVRDCTRRTEVHRSLRVRECRTVHHLVIVVNAATDRIDLVTQRVGIVLDDADLNANSVGEAGGGRHLLLCML